MGAQAVRLSNVDIDNALKNKDFEVLFQPIFDLGNGALARMETFLRWRHPTLGVLPPGAFISFFESQGRMSELTRYVLNEAIEQYSAWRGANAPGFSINLALSDLSDEAFSSHFDVLLRDRGFPADLITLECPMPPVTMDVDVAAAHFHRLAETGARLAIEVRGRANDFLRMIDPFPFDEIKTGGSAILRFARTVRGPGLSAISELLEIAAKANAAITAVGVEDQASLSALRGLGFAAAQGNHLDKVGSLSSFSPSRVNEVRTLLGLPPLSPEDLDALFRTTAPAPQNAHGPATPREETVAEKQPAARDDLVERLAQRLARQDAPEAAAETAPPEAVSLSEQPTVDVAAKAAAIARAKKKAAEKSAAENDAALQDESAVDQVTEVDAARSLQERLSREFSGAAASGGVDSDAAKPAVSGARDRQTSAKKTAPAMKTSPTPPKTPNDETKKRDAVRANDKDAAANTAKSENAVQRPAAAQSEKAVEPVASAAAAVAATSETATQAMMRVTLAVGSTHAYFRPGLRVGIRGAAPTTPVEDNTLASDSKPGVVAAEESQSENTGAREREIDPVSSDAEVEQAAQDDAAPESAKAETSHEAAEDASKPARLRKKNFLARKHRIVPTHFWPRSWKRAWRRRQTARENQRRLHDEAEAAE